MSEKEKIWIGDQDLDCHGKDKGVYEDRNHFDQAGLKLIKSFCDVMWMCECCLKSCEINCPCLR